MKQYDNEKIRELLKDYHTLTGVKIGVYESNRKEVCNYPQAFLGFCKIIRNIPTLSARCRLCDRMGFFRCDKKKAPAIYTCHAGLFECFSPILYQDKTIGYIAFGQIIPKGTSWETLRQNLEGITPEEEVLLKEQFAFLPTYDENEMQAMAHVLSACTGYEYLRNLVLLESKRIDREIASFILDNLHTDLSVARLCEQFRLSRSELYSIFHDYFQISPAEYIKNQRLKQACEYLRATNDPIHEVGERCGFYDYNYFSKVFKKEFRMSPREYRNKKD